MGRGTLWRAVGDRNRTDRTDPALFSLPPGAVKPSLIAAGAIYLGLVDHSLTAELRGLDLATLALQRFVMGFLWIPPHEANAIDPVSSLLNSNPALTGVCSCS